MRNWFAVVGLTLAVAGCSGISTNSDWDETFDFSGLSTYAWMDQGVEGGVSEIMLRRMYVAVDDDLASKGFIFEACGGALGSFGETWTSFGILWGAFGGPLGSLWGFQGCLMGAYGGP